MKKLIVPVSVALLLCAGAALADKVHDWHDLDAVHKRVQESIKDMEKARAANHYDMEGHGAKAEDLLKQAEGELHQAVESAKKAK